MRRALAGLYAALDAQRGRELPLAVPAMSGKRLANSREGRRFIVATAVYGVLTVCAVALVAVAGLEAGRRLVAAKPPPGGQRGAGLRVARRPPGLRGSARRGRPPRGGAATRAREAPPGAQRRGRLHLRRRRRHLR